MKTALIFLAVCAAQAIAVSDILGCFAPVMDNISADRADLQAWSEDVRDTSGRLQIQRQRCIDLPRDDPPTAIQDRIIQACNAAWSASVAYELSRLYNDLLAIDPELAAELRSKSGHCFPDLPQSPEPESLEYFKRILESDF